MSAVLVVDVGGSHVKVLASGEQESRRADSGPGLTAAQMVDAAKELAADWAWDSVSVGVPSPVHGGRVIAEPVNLGDGWAVPAWRSEARNAGAATSQTSSPD